MGGDYVDAMVEDGRVCAHPVLLTSISILVGISPRIFFATGQNALPSTLAVSLGYGLLFSAVLILLTLPCFYLIADDLREWFYRRLRHGRLAILRD